MEINFETISFMLYQYKNKGIKMAVNVEKNKLTFFIKN